MTPTEHEGTVAVDAAARKVYDDVVATKPPFDELDAPTANHFRRTVLPLVWAALTALPDRRRTAWLEGHAAGIADGTSVPFGETYAITDCPYPEESL